MPSIKLTDQSSVAVDITPNNDSAFLKYFKSLPDISLSDVALQLRKGLTLEDPVLTSLSSGVAFKSPVDLGTDKANLHISAGVSGTVGIFKPAAPEAKLFDFDPYGDPISVSIDNRYVSFGFNATLGADITASTGDLSFGFTAGSSLAVANYRLFTTKPTAPDVVDAISTTIAGFVIPGDIEDLQALPVGTVVTLNGAGSLKFSATANLLSAVNPLASASLLAPLPAVAVKAGAVINVGANVQLAGEYQIRVSKLGQKQVRLAYYRKSSSSFAVKVSASAGVSATIGDTELIGKLMSAISSDPKADIDGLKTAGLSQDQINGITNTIASSISRTLEVAISAELGNNEQESAAFIYDIDMGALATESRRAIHSALDGDLSALTTDPSAPLPGIHPVRDLFTNVREGKHSLVINLLGIVNYGSIFKLISTGKTLYEPTTGQLVISDTVTASRVSATVLDVGVADSEKLRHVLAESFLITVAYRGSRTAGLQPSLSTSHSFFALNEHTSQETLEDELDTTVALGLMEEKHRDEISRSAPEFGRTLYTATTSYDNLLSTELFLDNNEARPIEFYENAGLQAIAFLVQPSDFDCARLRPTRDRDLWDKMKDLGQPSIPTLFRDVPDPIVGAIVADYSLICWWAESMHNMAQKLEQMMRFLTSNPTADDQNNDFKKLKNTLADHLRSVAANTKESFGRPWGLLAMFLASGGRAGRKAILTGPNLSIVGEKSISHTLASTAS